MALPYSRYSFADIREHALRISRTACISAGDKVEIYELSFYDLGLGFHMPKIRETRHKRLGAHNSPQGDNVCSQ